VTKSTTGATSLRTVRSRLTSSDRDGSAAEEGRLNVRAQSSCDVIVTAVQTHANVPELTHLPVRGGGGQGVSRSMSEYADEIEDEELDWSDFEDASEYDDLDLPEIGRRRQRWKSKRS
jgi:hypothetical protein